MSPDIGEGRKRRSGNGVVPLVATAATMAPTTEVTTAPSFESSPLASSRLASSPASSLGLPSLGLPSLALSLASSLASLASLTPFLLRHRRWCVVAVVAVDNIIAVVVATTASTASPPSFPSERLISTRHGGRRRRRLMRLDFGSIHLRPAACFPPLALARPFGQTASPRPIPGATSTNGIHQR